MNRLAALVAYLRARPAVVAMMASNAATVAAALGLHLTPAQFTAVVTALNTLLGVAVHISSGPNVTVKHGEHEKPQGGSDGQVPRPPQ